MHPPVIIPHIVAVKIKCNLSSNASLHWGERWYTEGFSKQVV